MDNQNSTPEVSISTESQPCQTDKPTKPRKIKLLFIAIAAIALIFCQMASVFVTCQRAMKVWKPITIVPTCSSDGRLMCLGGEPFDDSSNNPFAYQNGTVDEQVNPQSTRVSDLFVLERLSGSVRQAGYVELKRPMFGLGFSHPVWSKDGLLAYFDGNPSQLCIYNASNQQIARKFPLGQIIASSDSPLQLDVMDWRGNKVLCRISTTTFNPQKLCKQIYFITDTSSGKVSPLTTAYQNDHYSNWLNTAYFFADGSVGVLSKSRLYRVTTDGKSTELSKGISNLCEILSSNGKVFTYSADRTKHKTIYDATTTDKIKLLATYIGSATPTVGPNGEVFIRNKAGLRMVYPYNKLITQKFGRVCIGGDFRQLIIWHWSNDNGTLSSEVRDVKHGYSLVSTASYKVRPSLRLLLASNWPHLGKVLGQSLLFILLTLLVLAIGFRIFPNKAFCGFAAIATNLCYYFGNHLLCTSVQNSEVMGISVGLYIVLDLVILASAATIWFLTTRYVKFDMPQGGWLVPKDPLVWGLLLIPIGLLVARYVTLPIKITPNSPNYMPLLIAYQFGVVALWEEFVFRGLLWHQLTRFKWRWPILLIVQALIFTAVHYSAKTGFLMPQKPALYYMWIFMLGLVLGAMRLRSKSIMPGWFAHGLYNTICICLYPYAWMVTYMFKHMF